MTAIVGILNKHGVAIAADSAVTIGQGEKILMSADKVFTLSKYWPVGIAIFGGAEFIGVPWEVIIKNYRTERQDTNHETLDQFAKDFLGYLQDNISLFPAEACIAHMEFSIGSYFEHLRKIIFERIESMFSIDPDTKLELKDIHAIAKEVLDEEVDQWTNASKVDGIDENEHQKHVLEKYDDLLDEIIANVFEKLPLAAEMTAQLKVLGACITYRRPDGMRAPGDCGVVIAGYGHNEIFPRLRSFNLYGLIDGVLNYSSDREVDISTEMDASITPFAQSEMVHTFMSGMDPNLKASISQNLDAIAHEMPDIILDSIPGLEVKEKQKLSRTLKNATQNSMKLMMQRLEENQHQDFISPVIHMVSALPKDELASMAEALVNLTSFKRHVSRQAETVGGPIDVAVISKGDGFIWIKRKHYFDPKLNHHFLSNYFN